MLETTCDRLLQSVGGTLDADAMGKLSSDAITLIAYRMMRDEVMDGGFIQLIHNGLGPFIFLNPFAKAMRLWGVDQLATMVNKGHKLYSKYHKEIERDCTGEEFMALFEKFPEFDDLDDAFVENEEELTDQAAHYVDDHLSNFVTIV